MTKILVVEDEFQILEEVVDWLKFEGYEAVGVTNGRLALFEIAKSMPDLIISDIAMPEMDGHELLLEVRSNPNLVHIPFIFLTAATTKSDVRRGMDRGADDYLTKPFTHAEVMGAIHARLQKKELIEGQMQSFAGELQNALNMERERHQLKARITAMFSHDFRNPLSAILSSSNIIRNYEAKLTPERKRQHLDRIDGSVHLMLQMLDDMLTLSQMESGHLEFYPTPTDLARFVGGIVEEFRMIDQDQHTLTYKPHLEHAVNIDSRLIRQIMANLISNALKYSPIKGEVVISLDEHEGYLRMIVSDFGMGIPQESLAHLFEWFYRAENAKNVKGTGVGLSIVRECVERHMGRIMVDSTEGKGTTFTVLVKEG